MKTWHKPWLVFHPSYQLKFQEQQENQNQKNFHFLPHTNWKGWKNWMPQALPAPHNIPVAFYQIHLNHTFPYGMVCNYYCCFWNWHVNGTSQIPSETELHQIHKLRNGVGKSRKSLTLGNLSDVLFGTLNVFRLNLISMSHDLTPCDRGLL